MFMIMHDLNALKKLKRNCFFNTESCNAQKFIDIALSQGGLQSILKANIDEINPFLLAFKEKINDIFGTAEFKIDFCYRMRIGVK